MFNRVLSGVKALFSLPKEQRWPAFKRAVKTGLAASAGAFLVASERLQELVGQANWADFLNPAYLHEFVTAHEDVLTSVGRALGVAVLTAILTALSEVTTSGPRSRMAERKGQAIVDRALAEQELYDAEGI